MPRNHVARTLLIYSLILLLSAVHISSEDDVASVVKRLPGLQESISFQTIYKTDYAMIRAQLWIIMCSPQRRGLHPCAHVCGLLLLPGRPGSPPVSSGHGLEVGPGPRLAWGLTLLLCLPWRRYASWKLARKQPGGKHLTAFTRVLYDDSPTDFLAREVSFGGHAVAAQLWRYRSCYLCL